MKNGAQVRWKGCKEFVSHYDCLPNITTCHRQQFLIEQVYAGKESSISHIGFGYFSRFLNITVTLIQHLFFDVSIYYLVMTYINNYFTENCINISKMELVGCNTIDNEALSKLNIMKDYLTNLKINGCINVSDPGIKSLEQLQ